MSEETFPEQMVAKLQALLLLAVGMDSVTIDGQSIKVTDLKAELDYWEAKVASASGANPEWMGVDMSGSM